MNTVTQVAAALSAITLIAVFPLEAFLINKPWAQRFLGIEPHGIANVHLWSFCLGARNALAGTGTLVGLWIFHQGDPTAGKTVVVTACTYMLASSLFMGVADALGHWLPRGGSVRGTIASATPPGIALAALAF